MRSDFDALLKVNQLKRLRAEARLAVILGQRLNYSIAIEDAKSQLGGMKFNREADGHDICLEEAVYFKWLGSLKAGIAETELKMAELESDISAARAALGQVIASDTVLETTRTAKNLASRLEREVENDELTRAIFPQTR